MRGPASYVAGFQPPGTRPGDVGPWCDPQEPGTWRHHLFCCSRLSCCRRGALAHSRRRVSFHGPDDRRGWSL